MDSEDNLPQHVLDLIEKVRQETKEKTIEEILDMSVTVVANYGMMSVVETKKIKEYARKD